MITVILILLLLTAGNILLVFPVRRGKKHLKACGILLPAELLLLFALYQVLCRFTLCDAPELPLVSFAAAELCVSALFLRKPADADKLRRFLRTCAKCVSLTVLLELAVFCGFCYHTQPLSRAVPLAGTLTEGKASLDGEILVTGDAVIRVPIEMQGIRYLHLSVESEDAFYRLICRMTDENFAHTPQETGYFWMNPSQSRAVFAVAPYGRLHTALFQFYDVAQDTPVRITGMTVSNVKPYSFSLLRVLVLAGILCLLAAVRCFGWHRICYDRRSLLHRESIAVMLILCVFAVFAVLPSWNAQLIPYDKSAGVDTYDPYAQTFDAWQRGQLHLEVPVDPILAEMEDPYDYSARNAAGAAAEWDKAFYQGKYYSYFGIAPVIFVYYPIWLCTGKIPTTALAAAIFTAAGMVFLFLLLLTLLRRYCRRVNFLLLLCGLAAAASASGLFLCANFADRYYVALAAGICFLYLYLWLGMEAVMAKKALSRCFLLAGCGIAIAAAVLSRPTIALYAILLVPPFWTLIRQKELNLRQKTAAVASFAVPLAIGAAVTMAYNAARFSSPFDFGSTYQLTVSNIAANRVTLHDFPAAMVHYFLNPAEFGGPFPFIRHTTAFFAQNGRYFYIDPGFGACMFLCIPAAALLLPRMSGKSEQRAVCICAFVLPVLIAFLDYCMGGYNPRYLCDILPVLAVFSVLLILHAQHRYRKIPAMRRAAALVFLQAPIIQAALLLSLADGCALWLGMPELYHILRDTVEFWR